MVTFTLPAQFRTLAWQQQRVMYDLITRSAWETVNTFSRNDRKLRGTTGAVTLLHTHNRRLDYHPHVHLVMPSAAFDNKRRLWRNKDGRYLFDHKALAKVFSAKMLTGIKQAALKLPDAYPTEWVVDCKAVGGGRQALIYLGRYLYRGVIQEKDILSCDKGNVTFRYQNSQTRRTETRTLSGVAFLRLILQHILPKGYRRARNFGFLHPNSKLILLVQLRKRVVLPIQQSRPASRCKCCGGEMKITAPASKHSPTDYGLLRRTGRGPCNATHTANLPDLAGGGALALKKGEIRLKRIKNGGLSRTGCCNGNF